MASEGQKNPTTTTTSSPPSAPSSSSPPASSSSNPMTQIPKVVQLSDRFGNKLHFGNAGDYWHPPLPIGANSDYRTHVRRIRDMEIRDDDLLLCSFPKTGLHWHDEIINQLRNNSSQINPEGHKFVFLDAFPMPVVEAAPSPRILVTHVPFRYLPVQALKKKIKVIYLLRNPKDTMVSLYNHCHNMAHILNYAGTFEHFFYLSFECGYHYGDMFDYLMDFQNGMAANPEVPFFTSIYEDMKKDPVGGVERLNEYLATGCSKEMCEAIAVSCGFQKLKAFKDATMPDKLKALFKKDATAGFYRKGEVGDWKNWFTVAMNEFFEEEYRKRMADFKIKLTYLL